MTCTVEDVIVPEKYQRDDIEAEKWRDSEVNEDIPLAKNGLMRLRKK